MSTDGNSSACRPTNYEYTFLHSAATCRYIYDARNHELQTVEAYVANIYLTF
jgi:hypothetical protein